MIEITLASAIEGITALVEEKGSNFVYKQRLVAGSKRCLYTYEGKADCIVGQFLAAQGVSLERLEEANTCTFGGDISASGLIEELEDENLVRASQNAIDFLGFVQYGQDHGKSWGEALADAKEWSGV